jgi:malonyl-CoA O-methyltransferase
MLQRAAQWIKQNNFNNQAILITHQQRRPYPEVTGYYIPTLLAMGEMTFAEQFARWLVTVQNENGSFSLHDPTISYVFDTGQVIRGWVSIVDRLPELLEPLQRACDWMIENSNIVTGQFLCPPAGGDWSLGARGEVNEGIHLYVIKPMQEAAVILKNPYIRTAADRALNYYLKNSSVTNFMLPNALTHLYAYMQEALVELGCLEQARAGMASVAAYQQLNGAVPAYHDVTWVCSTGLAQLARVWYLLDEVEHAENAMHFLAQLQNGSGGFYGSYGVNATYFPNEEISWAVKYAIDAEHTRIAKHFDQTAHHYTTTIAVQDGRVQAVFSALEGASCVLDAGCGKGRYAALIKQHFPQIEVHAVDVSDEMLRHVPQEIYTKNASIQDLPYANASFDVVFCVEALEHVPHPEAAITEMIRVLNPGGKLIIIDKNLAKQGMLQIEAWEQWFDVNALCQFLQQSNLSTHVEFIGYDNKPADGLFVAWVGVKSLIPAIQTAELI